MGYLINGETKVITLTAGTTSVSVRDLWSRWVDWFLTGDNSKYLPAFEFVGGNDIDPSQGTYIPIYAFLMNGWKIKPQEANHTLSIGDGVLLVNGGGDPFNNTTGSYVVRINYQQPVQAIAFSTEGGSTGPTAEDIANAVWSANNVEELVTDLAKITGNKVTKDGDLITIYEENGITVWKQYNLANGGRVEV
jgi:hypothetical protein